MKKVLIITYDFPPYNSAGSQRPYSWFKYFAEFGLYPIIITRQWDSDVKTPMDYIRVPKNNVEKIEEFDSGTIIRVPYEPNFRDKFLVRYGKQDYRFIRKTLTAVYSISRFLFSWADNTSNILSKSMSYLNNNDCHAILATGEPFIVFKYASLLSKKFNIPWIADYRDGWTTYTNVRQPDFITALINKSILNFIERRIVKSCHSIVTVSEDLKNNLKKNYDKKVFIAYNGYDDEIIKQNNKHLSSHEVFTISYAGTVYPYQRLEIFLEGFKSFVETYSLTPKDVVLNFYGIDLDIIQKNRLFSYDDSINRFIKTTHRLNYVDTIKKLSQSHVLLVLANENKDGSCTKIYDYLALNKRIVVCVNDHMTLQDIITNTNSGFLVENSSQSYSVLSNLYAEFKEKKELKGTSDNYEIYSRRNQAGKLAKFISEIIN